MGNHSLLRYIRFILPSLVLVLFISSAGFAQDGAAIFNANCASCHAVKEKRVGPALKGIASRRSEEWVLKWVHNSTAVVNSGDEYAVKLFNDNNKTPMPAFNLKDAEIKAILAYIKTEEQKPDATAATQPAGGTGTPEAPAPIWPYLLVALVVLLLLSSVLGRVQRTLEKTLRHKEGKPEPEPKTRTQSAIYWIRHNKKLVAIILIFCFLWGSVKGWYALMGIGVTQGYTPDQPIAYSHKLHAGDLQIQCIYCHSGAERGKTAGIPSANVCMNCHKYVTKGPTTGTTEIAKIYKALDYDPDKGTYGPNQKPIQWVRVHNLPDLAYFNHAQHFVVGKIACQTCHGPVQDSMTVAMQYSPLTMGWCINCHRQTRVKMEGNGYYEDYHKKLKAELGGDSLITVEKIGGTECARCHY